MTALTGLTEPVTEPVAGPAELVPPAPRAPRGRFGKGNPGGPGRPRGGRAIDEVVSREDELELWQRELFLASVTDDAEARRFILATKLGKARAPALSALDLGDISTLEGVQNAMRIVFDAQGAGRISPDEFDYRLSALERAAKIIETVTVVPMLAELRERVEAMEAGG